MNKTSVSQWIINIIITILFAGVGIIYGSVMDRIDKVEAKVETFNPIFIQIQKDLSDINSRLSGIAVDIEWLKNK